MKNQFSLKDDTIPTVGSLLVFIDHVVETMMDSHKDQTHFIKEIENKHSHLKKNTVSRNTCNVTRNSHLHSQYTIRKNL